MRHLVKMVGWPGHDIELEFYDEDGIPGVYRDAVEVFIDGKKHACISFNAEDRDPEKPTLVVDTHPVYGTWTEHTTIRLIGEEKEDYKEPRP